MYCVQSIVVSIASNINFVFENKQIILKKYIK